MGWRDLLQTEEESVISPWVGGRSLRTRDRAWTLLGRLPPEHGWYTFAATGRKARLGGPAQPREDALSGVLRGYLVGDRLLPDGVRVTPDIGGVIRASERVHLVEPGLDRFVRVAAGRPYEQGPLVYRGQEFPLGPEDQVLQSFLDGRVTVEHVAGVAPALDAAFRVEVWRRDEAERRRREEEEQRRLGELRAQIAARLGDGEGRRAMARVDFASAARAALAVGDALYQDHRPTVRRGEVAVRFRLDGRRFECVCDEKTLRIIDSGICLVDHATDERGDTRFTLESLPAVIRLAQQEGSLVVFRNVN